MNPSKILSSPQPTTASYEVQQPLQEVALLSLWKAFRKNHVLQALHNGWRPCEEQNMAWNHFLGVVPLAVAEYWSNMSNARSSRPIDRLDDHRFERWKYDFIRQAIEFGMECDYIADKLGVLDEHKNIFRKGWNETKSMKHTKDERLQEDRHKKAFWELWREVERTYQDEGESKLSVEQRKALWDNFFSGESPELRQQWAIEMRSSEWTPTDIKLTNKRRRLLIDYRLIMHARHRNIQFEEALRELSICDKETRAHYEKVWAGARDDHPANQHR